ncbi:MAG: competence/damage-inducible protein A [Defluviitaleaceae bacterium]|nr:competence/damage-inducible protein A [Defluviitaleaceae bacterium]
MTAEIISVGTELLLGDIVNTNAAFLARELAVLGISVYTQTVTGDNPKRLKRAFDQAYERGVDLIIATGGLGPTEDDLTKEVAAEYFELPLKLHDPTWESILNIFAALHPNQKVTPNNKKQAMVPEGCHIFHNYNGTAPGIYIESQIKSKGDVRKKMILLPGPPSEMEPMFLKQVTPFLGQQSQKVLVSKVLKISSIGESMVEHRIKSLIDQQDNPTIAPYARMGEVWLRITASAEKEEEAQDMIVPVSQKLHDILGNAIFGEDEDTLEGSIASLLNSKGMTLACAESCTGGMVISKMTNHPGVSDVLLEGAVTYSNEAKVNRLGVEEDLIKHYGAVSEEVAEAMAVGVAKKSGAKVGLSTTGIAGPGGATEGKPVGLVYIGLYLENPDNAQQPICKIKKLTLNGDRAKIRTRTTMVALDFLRLTLLELEE